jgi:hypothetical protein
VTRKSGDIVNWIAEGDNIGVGENGEKINGICAAWGGSDTVEVAAGV